MADDDKGGAEPKNSQRLVSLGEKALEFAENVVYSLVAILLVSAALVLVVDAGREFANLGDGADTVILTMLDRLLLVFILVELLFAVRMTLIRREIVAEPFLIVGIIASIKEIILLSVEVANVIEGKETIGENPAEPATFALMIGLLGGLVLVLSASALILRLKERAPVEGKRSAKEREGDSDGDGLADDDSGNEEAVRDDEREQMGTT